MSTIFIGKDTDGSDQQLLLAKSNRHGMVAGATGTGKTVTLQILSEGFSKAGVPVFAADVKGDLSGISQSGSEDHKLHEKLLSRADKSGWKNTAMRPCQRFSGIYTARKATAYAQL